MAPVLGYWNVRGLGTPIRLMLEQAGVEYKERLYVCGPPPDFDRSDYLKEKFNLGLDFPNLPYYIDGDIKLTQSQVILRHLARKHNLDGKNEADKSRIDMLSSTVLDYIMAYAKITYNPDFLKLRDDYAKELQERLKLLSKFLGDNQFVAGDYLTYADFVLFEFFETQLYFDPKVFNDFPSLAKFHQRISKLPAVEKYFNSDKAIKFPFAGAISFFGGQYSDQLLKK